MVEEKEQGNSEDNNGDNDEDVENDDAGAVNERDGSEVKDDAGTAGRGRGKGSQRGNQSSRIQQRTRARHPRCPPSVRDDESSARLIVAYGTTPRETKEAGNDIAMRDNEEEGE